MHSINIGICRNHNFIVSKIIYAFLNVKGGLEKVELFVLVNNFLS